MGNKIYQDNVIQNLSTQANLVFSPFESPKTFVLKAPTGSGKTRMLAFFIDTFIKAREDLDLVFLWVSVGSGGLHRQSAESVSATLGGSPKCILLEEDFKGQARDLPSKSIIFVDWESLNSKKGGLWTNSLMKSGENNSFPDMLRNTRNRGAHIILIIDESHASASTERAKDLRENVFKADLTVEASATPSFGDQDIKITVTPEQVIAEEMMKKYVFLNEGIDNAHIPEEDVTSQELIMQKAFDKREELAKAFKAVKSIVNPLCLIQIPDTGEGQDKIDFLTHFLGEKGITVENEKLVIWLQDTSKNVDQHALKKLDNPVEFLIFKQAIALGWDCPRAHVLVRFREIKSFVFETQVVGRILRTPEQKFYSDERLNIGYAYTNLRAVIVANKEEYDNNILTLTSIRKDLYKSLQLDSDYQQRGAYNDINNSSVDFKAILEKYFIQYLGLEKTDKYLYYQSQLKALKKGFDFFDPKAKDKILGETKVDSRLIDTKVDINPTPANGVSVTYSEEDLQAAFDDIIRRNLQGLAFVRSSSRIRTSLIKCFYDYFGVSLKGDGFVKIQQSVVRYAATFDKILGDSVRMFKELDTSQQLKDNLLSISNWEVPESRMYNPNCYVPVSFQLSLFDPFYMIKPKNHDVDELELAFTRYLDLNPSRILWVWQNGQEDVATNFGILTKKGNIFRPDWLIMFKDGTLGVFDTKAIGKDVDDTTNKANALHEFVSKEQSKGKKIVGGIIVQEPSGSKSFRLNSFYPYVDFADDHDHQHWTYFGDLLGVK
jgi:type III restriction enzyme